MYPARSLLRRDAPSTLMSQVEGSAPCSTEEARQFDFWIGDWDCTWGEDGRGTNTIRATLDGCVIEEHFDANPTADFRGMSISTYSPTVGKWLQTWVDNAGNYFDLSGGMQDDRMVLVCDELGTAARLRMVFHNIQPDGFDWEWERSEDQGRTWETRWSIRYQRRGSLEGT